MSNPRGVALDSQGNFYLSDQNNNRVREVNTPNGSVLFPTTAVGSTSVAVTIPLVINAGGTTITGISAAVSQGGKQEYAATTTGCGLNTALTVSTICNVSVTFSPGYSGQRSVPLQVVSSAGTFAFAMTGIGTAPQVALSPGIITTVPGASGDLPVGLITGSVAVDSAGNLYFASGGGMDGNFVLELAAGASTATVVASGYGNYTDYLNLGVAVDGAGNVYVANPNFSTVTKTPPGTTVGTIVAGVSNVTGSGGYSGDNGPATNAELNLPYAVAVDGGGNLYIADTNNNRVRKVSVASGIITTVAGNGTAGYSGDNGPATSAELNSPQGLAVDAAGNLYILDTKNNRIRKVASSGVITTVAGNGTAGYTGDGGPASSAEVNAPQGLAIDAAGDLYLTDTVDNVVRMVNGAGIITTVAGNGTAGGSVDNGPALDGELQYPTGVAIDSAGNLYISAPLGPASPSMRLVNTSTSALNFGNTSPGSTNTQTVAVMNIGNAPLTFATPVTGQNPSISNAFTQDSSSSCPQLSSGSPASTLSAGAGCNLVIDFMPVAAGSSTGTASITDNNLNANTVQTVQLTGTAQTVLTTTTINVATPNFGQTQVSATVLATAGTAVPMGTVVFTVDGVIQPAVALNASAVATLPSAVSDALAVGSHTIAAVYTSSSVEFGTSNATRIFSVAQAIPPTVTIAPSTTSLTVSAGSSVTDTLTLTPVGGYTGTLQFSCTNLPQNATCSFQPSTVTLTGTGGPQTVVATIQTAGGTAELRLANPSPAQNGPVSPAVVFWGSGLLTMALATKKRGRFLRSYHLLVFLALLAGSGLMIACGGGSSASQSTAPTAPTSPSSVTPAGTSAVQIAASSSGTKVQSFTVTLTVQ